MSTYVLMRILESAPGRYDAGMRLLTLGGLDRAYDRLASRVEPGSRVLDVGCGTGALGLRAARRGARVKGIDRDPAMLEIARQRASDAGLADSIELVEVGVADLDTEEAESYDTVMSGLCLSELSDDEIAYALAQARRLLRPGGLLLVAEETRPGSRGAGWIVSLLRAPLAALAYLVTRRTTRPVADLPKRLANAGFEVESLRRSALGSFCELAARRPERGTP